VGHPRDYLIYLINAAMVARKRKARKKLQWIVRSLVAETKEAIFLTVLFV
jgi:hypothetical protein